MKTSLLKILKNQSDDWPSEQVEEITHDYMNPYFKFLTKYNINDLKDKHS